MKKLNNYIVEKLKLTKDSKSDKIEYTCQPKDWDELRAIIKERLEKDKDADLNDIDVSQITSMYNEKDKKGLFAGLDPHDIKIDKWNVSNVTNMKFMFVNCHRFNCNLSNWNVSNVTNMFCTFYNCYNFDCDLSKWDVSKVKTMYEMFKECKYLNIPSWYYEKIK